VRGLRPHESATLESLSKQAQPIATKPENLDSVAGFATKDKQLSGIRIFGQLRLHQGGQSVETLAHIGRAGGKPDLHSGGQRNHWRESTLMTRASVGRSTRPRTRNRTPPANSISIEPLLGSFAGALAVGALALLLGISVGVETFTGNRVAFPEGASSTCTPCWYSRRHPNRRLAFTLCR
jgi:hypothetical protein